VRVNLLRALPLGRCSLCLQSVLGLLKPFTEFGRQATRPLDKARARHVRLNAPWSTFARAQALGCSHRGAPRTLRDAVLSPPSTRVRIGLRIVFEVSLVRGRRSGVKWSARILLRNHFFAVGVPLAFVQVARAHEAISRRCRPIPVDAGICEANRALIGQPLRLILGPLLAQPHAQSDALAIDLVAERMNPKKEIEKPEEGEEGAEEKEPSEKSEEEEDENEGEITPRTLQKRVDALTESITFESFTYTRRGTLERHKLLLATLLCLRINMRKKLIKENEV